MKTSALTLAAVGAVALSALAFVPKPAQAFPVYQFTLGFTGSVVNDTCMVTVEAPGLAPTALPLNTLNALGTLTLPYGVMTQQAFDANGNTNRQVISLTVGSCPSSVNTVTFAFVPNNSTLGTNGIVSNTATGNTAA